MGAGPGRWNPSPVMIPDASPDNPKPFYVQHNGGLIYRHRAEFEKGDRLVRFASGPTGRLACC